MHSFLMIKPYWNLVLSETGQCEGFHLNTASYPTFMMTLRLMHSMTSFQTCPLIRSSRVPSQDIQLTLEKVWKFTPRVAEKTGTSEKHLPLTALPSVLSGVSRNFASRVIACCFDSMKNAMSKLSPRQQLAPRHEKSQASRCEFLSRWYRYLLILRGGLLFLYKPPYYQLSMVKLVTWWEHVCHSGHNWGRMHFITGLSMRKAMVAAVFFWGGCDAEFGFSNYGWDDHPTAGNWLIRMAN